MKFSFATVAMVALQLLHSSEARRDGGQKGGRGGDSVASVFTMTNNPFGNEVVMYSQDSTGALTEDGRFDTGGLGSGAGVFVPADPLASQGSLIANNRGDRLFAVNSGDSTLSVFRVKQGRRSRLRVTDVVDTGGSDPVSVATCGRFVYVLNGGGEGSIVGFRMTGSGKLFPIKGSERSVSAIDQGSNPAFFLSSPGQVSFTEDCSRLVIVNKDIPLSNVPPPDVGPPGPATPGRLLVFGVDRWGIPDLEPVVTDLGGVVPFSFNLVESNGSTFLYTTDVIAAGSSVFEMQNDNSFSLVQETVFNGGQGAPCWNANNGEFYFIANTLGNSISSYRIEEDNELSLIESTADARAGSEPTDMAYENGFLYQLFPGTGELIVYAQSEGLLTEVGSAEGLLAAPEPPAEGGFAFASEMGGPVGIAVIPAPGDSSDSSSSSGSSSSDSSSGSKDW